MNTGKLIVIEGTDGSGKGTQTELLIERWNKEKVEHRVTDFPQYAEPSSYFVSKYLQGKYGSLEEVGPYKASYFYALDRFDKSFEMKAWLEQGKHIVSNRYVTSSMGHQTGKIDSREEQDKFLDWLADLEYNTLGIPRPDLVIFLYVPPEIGQKLVGEKAKREYTQGKTHDIHESHINHLQKASEAYQYVAQKFGWHQINCIKDGELMSREEIHELVQQVVSDFLSESKI